MFLCFVADDRIQTVDPMDQQAPTGGGKVASTQLCYFWKRWQRMMSVFFFLKTLFHCCIAFALDRSFRRPMRLHDTEAAPKLYGKPESRIKS